MTALSARDRRTWLGERAQAAWQRLYSAPGQPQWLDVPVLVVPAGRLESADKIALTVLGEDGRNLGPAMVYRREWYPGCSQQQPFSHYAPTLLAILRAREIRASQGDEASRSPLRLQLLQAVAAETWGGRHIVVLLKYIIAPEYTLTGRQLETVYNCPLQLFFTGFLGIGQEGLRPSSVSNQVRGQVLHEAYRRAAAALLDGLDDAGVKAAYLQAIREELLSRLVSLCNPLVELSQGDLEAPFKTREIVLTHCRSSWGDDNRPRQLYLERLLYSPSRGISGRADRIEEPSAAGRPWRVVELKTGNTLGQRHPATGERHPGGLQALAYWEILRSLGVEPVDALVEVIGTKGTIQQFSLDQHVLTTRARITWGKHDDPRLIDLIAQARNIGYCLISGLFTGYDRERLDNLVDSESWHGFRIPRLYGDFDLMAEWPPCYLCPANRRHLCSTGWRMSSSKEVRMAPMRRIFASAPNRLFAYWMWFHRQLKEEERQAREALFHLIATPPEVLERQEGITICHLQLVERHGRLARFAREQRIETRIREDDKVLVTPEQYAPGQQFSVEGYVQAVEEQAITVALDDARLPEGDAVSTFRLDLSTGHDMPQWQIEGVTNFFLTTMASVQARSRKVTLAELPPLAQTLLGVRAPALRDSEVPEDLAMGLNEEQRRALSVALGMKAGEVLLIQGPPGTGKTQLIAAIARAVFLSQLFETVPSQKPVLVLANTHRAANEVVLKLVQRYPELRPFIVRFGAGRLSSLEEPVRQQLLAERIGVRQIVDQLSDTEEWDKHVDQLWRAIQRGRIMLEHAGIFVGTLGSVSSPEIRGLHFSTVIVDEAGQATEPAMLQALRRLPKGYAGRLILVGDHCQLPPVVTQEVRPPAIPALEKLGWRDGDSLRTSGFERLARLYPEAVLTLRRQYRMNDAICHLVSETFYDGQLIPGTPHVAQRRLANWLQQMGLSPITEGLLSGDPPIVLIETTHDPAARDTGALEATREESWFNPREAVVIAQLLGEWIRQFPVEVRAQLAEGIGIISPYRRQNTFIRQEVARADPALGNARVDTVDRFQGGERPIIVLSLVNSNGQGRIGSLHADWRRMNVALSRAQYLLVIVGDPATFLAAPTSPAEEETRQRYQALFSGINRLAQRGQARIVSSLAIAPGRLA